VLSVGFIRSGMAGGQKQRVQSAVLAAPQRLPANE
jgi:hypothetical protein